MKNGLLLELRSELINLADPKKAPQMQSYMKSAMPYHGVPSPILKKLCKEIFRDLKFPHFQSWEKQVMGLWRNAKFREERYASLQLCGHKISQDFQTLEAMKLFEEMIVSGAWWDYVDDIASHKVGNILDLYPKPMKKKMLKWSHSSDLWKKRTSIICQLGFGHKTDLDLMYACIEPSLSSDEFFLRKAVGWALRQYAWTDPKEVKRYVKKNEERLSPLSRREALKNIL